MFLPPRQHARLAVEITQPFNWPSDTDSGSIEKLRSFVKQRLQNVGEFVLFDEANHRQLELPSGWDQLEETSGAVLLQQAAVETVRHWKYEPARLDGKAVAMHLTVTVRFRFN